MVLSKSKRARRASLRKARLAKQLNQSGYQINADESGHVDEDSIKVEVKEEPEDDDPCNFANGEDFHWNTEEYDLQGSPPVLPSSSSTITPSLMASSSNRQCEYRCLLCYKTSYTTSQLTDCEESSFRTMFLMKKMFGIPNAMLEDYLKTFGNPSTWISICLKCKLLVDKALGVQKKINQLETILKTCQQEIIGAVKKSQTAVQLIAKSSQNNIIRVTNEARKFVVTGVPDQKEDCRYPHPNVSSYAFPEATSSVNFADGSDFDDASPQPDFSKQEPSPPIIPGRSLERSTLRDVRDEELIMNSSTTTYTCNLCPHLNGRPLQSFLIHIMFHHNRPFQCSGCKIYYAHPKELDVSPVSNEKNRKEDDHVCTVDTLVETKFKGKEVWSCDKCSKMFDEESERDLHEHQVHWNQNMMEYKYKCITCSRKFKHFNDWRLHRVLEHPEVASLSCYFCDEYFGAKTKEGVGVLLNREDRRAHVKKQHGNNICKYDLKACDHCGETFVNATELSSHQQEAHGLPPKSAYSCQVCWKRFQNYTSVTAHLMAHRAGVEAYVCETCGHTSTRQSTLAQHNLVAHGIRPASSRLTIHTCKIEGCKFESITKRPFEKHMVKVHGADRNYTCQFCGKGFLDPKHCRAHEQTHTNKTTKPYKCEICGNSFAVKNYLYIHMRLSHLNRPFASTHKKRPYRKRVASKTTSSGSTQRCAEALLSSGPVESTVAPPPPLIILRQTDVLHHDNT